MNATAVSEMVMTRKHRASIPVRGKIEAIVCANKYDFDASTEALIKAARGDAALREFIFEQGAKYCVRKYASDTRVAVSNPSADDGEVKGSVPTAVPARKHNAGYMHTFAKAFIDHWTLPGSGVVIGDASAADLRQSSEFLNSQELGVRRNRQFVDAVRKRVPEGKKVRDVFTSAQLKKMHGVSR